MSAEAAVTVVTPTYNRQDLLPATIESVLGQTFKNLRYVVIDDGSTDATESVVRPYAGRLEYLWKENAGEAAAINDGWRMATSKYFAVVSSDDPMLPTWLERAVAFMELHPDVLVGYPDWVMIDHAGRPMQTVQVYEYSPERLFGWLHCLPGPGAIIRRSALTGLAALRNPDLRYTSDLDCWFRLAMRGRLARIPETLAMWRLHEGSISVADRTLRRSMETLSLVDRLFRRDDLPREVAAQRRLAQSRAWYLASVFIQETYPSRALYYRTRSLVAMPREPATLPPELRRHTLPWLRNWLRRVARTAARR